MPSTRGLPASLPARQRAKESAPFTFKKGDADCTFSLHWVAQVAPFLAGECPFSPRKGEAGCTFSGSGVHLFSSPFSPLFPQTP